ncbi:MAG: GAF domain-containing protein [Anaerolineaceae bacterium]|nr:MAG: GAF domain-containing protein [Anaerolineaceae bacterium]
MNGASMNQKTSSFQGRMMRRLTGVIVVALVVLIGIVSLLLYQYLQVQALDNKERGQVTLTELIDREIAGITDDLVRVTTSASMTGYAASVARFDDPASAVLALPDEEQRQVLRSFDDLMRRGGDRFNAVRYISRSGVVLAEAQVSGNEILITPSGQPVMAFTPGLPEALSTGRAGQPFFGTRGNDDRNLLYLYAPVSAPDSPTNVLGVVQLVIRLDTMESFIATQLNSAPIRQDGRRAVVMDSAGSVLIGAPADVSDTVRQFLAERSGALSPQSAGGEVVSARTLNAAANGLNTPWRVVMIDDSFQLFGGIFGFVGATAGIIALVIGVAVVLMNIVVNRTTRPLRLVSTKAARAAGISAGEESPDILETLQESIGRIDQRLTKLTEDLTEQINIRSRDIQLASRIGREISGLYDLNDLLDRTVDLIAEELGFYHAQVFLVDDANVNAILTYSRGEAGKRLLAENFAIEVGSLSVIGQVVARGQPLIVNDTHSGDAMHGFNPILAETRAEIGLPLMSKGEVIGVLDIQSRHPNVFLQENLPTYSLLADQIAVAIQNARLVGEAEERYAEIERLNEQMTRRSWQEVGGLADVSGAHRAYRYNLIDVQEAEPDDADNLKAALRSPINVRGQVIGNIAAEVGEDYNFTQGDAVVMQAVASRVALAIENARLFSETQQTLSETETLYQLSRFLNEADTLEDIVRALVAAVMTDASGGQVWMFDDYPQGGRPEWMSIRADLALADRDTADHTLASLRLGVADHPFLYRLPQDEATLIENVRRDDRLDSGLKLVLRRLKAEAAIIIPLIVRGAWRGLITIGFPQVKAFTTREARVYNALSDQVGVAIDNRLLLEQTEAEVQRNENLYAASRIINTAQNAQDLVFAAVATSDDPDLSYGLIMLEPPEDDSGWPTTARMVARSEGQTIHELDAIIPLTVERDSPMRNREPEIMRDEVPGYSDVSPRVAWMRELGYRFMAIFPLFSANQPIALFYMAAPKPHELTSADHELLRALTGQMSSQIQIRRLLELTQTEQRYLRSVLETLPTGVLVLDPQTLIPTQYNQQAIDLLGDVDFDAPYNARDYALYRTDSDQHYPEDEVPITVAINEGRMATADDIAVILPDGEAIELLMNAAPITDEGGVVTSVVVALQDITNLRKLERSLNDNLRETTALYEAQRQLAAAASFDDVLSSIMLNLIMIDQTAEVYILLSEANGDLRVARSKTITPDNPEVLRPLLDPREVVIINDLPDSDIPADTRHIFQRTSAGSLITLPVNVSLRDEPVGWMLIAMSHGVNIDQDDRRFLTQLRDATAVALDNRLLIESQESTLREVRSLYAATAAISRSHDVSALRDALNHALATVGGDYAFVSVEASVGLPEGENVLLSVVPDDGPQIDFRDILYDYDIAPGGTYINDLNRTLEREEAEERLLSAGVVAFAAIRLRLRDTMGGLLVVAHRQPHNFSDSEDRYLNTLADGTGVLLNTFALFSQIQSSLEETSTLYQASRDLYEATSPTEILNVAVTQLVGSHHTLAMIVLLESPDWDVQEPVARVEAIWREDGQTDDLAGKRLNPDNFALWDRLAARELTVVDDVLADERLTGAQKQALAGLAARSFTIVPLRVPQRPIGALLLASTEVYRHRDSDERTYQSFGEQASLSMQADYLLLQTERRARQLKTLADVNQNVAQLIDLEQLFPRLVTMIQEAFDYDHVQIFVMDAANQNAELRASTGNAGRLLMAINHHLAKGSDSVVGRTVARGEAQIIHDTLDGSATHRPNPYLPNTRSEIGIPLVIKGRVVGALDVQSNQPNTFSEEDIELLTTLASQITVAIDNANLYQSAQTQAGQMQFLFEITSAAAAAETIDDTLNDVALQMQSAFEASAVVAYLPKDYIDETSKDQTPVTFLEAATLVGSDRPLDEIESVRLDDTDRLLAEIARDRRPRVIEDTNNEKIDYVTAAMQTVSAIILPLTVGSRLVGMIVMESAVPDAYDYDTIQLLLTLSGSLSAVVESSQLVEQLQKTNEQLRELDRLKSDFLANMSHELRTPLNSIIGFSRVMLKGIDGPLTEMQEQDLTTIYNSGQHLLMLINDVLDQAKIAADKLDLKFAPFEIKPLIEGVKAIGIGLVRDKPVDLRIELAPNMPQVYGDEFRTRQILLNLVSNASKFTNDGEIIISAYPIETADGGMMMRVDVSDTGIGIAQKDIGLLFEAFRQVDSSLTRTAGGTGLGLPIAKSLAELQGGDMLVSSEVNVGSVFSITIPVYHGDEDRDDATLDEGDHAASSVYVSEGMDKPETKPDRKTATVEAAAVNGGGKRIQQNRRDVLLIEDSKDMVDQFRRTLQREGFDVQTADHEAYAEAMASNLRPNLIVMDVNFAKGEGWNILGRLKDRDDTFDIPVIVVTLDADTERAYKLGAHTVIQRPYDPEELVSAALKAEQESNIERILIIDDEPEAVRLLTQLLNQNGTYRVFSAENGLEGISLVARRRPDLIILDLRMPGMDGFRVLEELRQNPETAAIPVLIVTGDIDLKSDEQAQLSNVRVLHKTDISEEEFTSFISDVERELRPPTDE